jgi:hypothetical protein
MDGQEIGRVRFTDGARRPVYADGDRQFVIQDGERVYGVYLIPEEDQCDAPLIVSEPVCYHFFPTRALRWRPYDEVMATVLKLPRSSKENSIQGTCKSRKP